MITCTTVQDKSIVEIIMELLQLTGQEIPGEIGGTRIQGVKFCTSQDQSFKIARGGMPGNRGEFQLFAEWDDATGGYRYAWMIQFNAEHIYTLADMELFGKKLSELKFISLHLQQLIFANGSISEVDEWNEVIRQELGSKALEFPGRKLEFGVRLLGSLSVGTTVMPVGLFLGFGEDESGLTAPGRAVAETPADYRREIWYEAQFTFGPLTFRRIGLKYAGANLYLMLDAVMAVSGVELELDGLGVSTSIWEWTPAPHLDGMALVYDIQPLVMGGSFLEENSSTYSGAAIVEILGRSFSAIGSYADRGVPSLFIYVRTNEALGGPPYFYVEGLGFGFGINRRFLEPALDDAVNFPLLKELKPDEAIRELENDRRPWIREEIGTNWLAVGVEFTTFRFIRSKMLLIGQFGRDMEIILLGRSTLELPDESNHFVFIETLMKGNWKPREGFVGISGKITDNSYLFDRDCKLTGDYAAWFWYDGKKKGDFIISAGGYHPQFQKPDHYPSLSRISISWPLRWGTIKGSAYFALTPSAVMSGGDLELTYGGGDIKAGLTAYANVLVEWKPFFFDASFGVNVWASVRLHSKYVGSWTWKGELGADFKLWGQPTGGEVYLGNKYIGLTISYGARKPEKKDASQDEFMDMLPGKTEYLRILPQKGLVKELPDKEWIIRPNELKFAMETGIPLLRYSWDGNPQTNVKPTGTPVPGIRPLKVDAIDESLLNIRMKYNGGGSPIEFKLNPNETGVPEALWGSQNISPGPQSSTLWHAMGITATPVEAVADPTATLDLQKKYALEPLKKRAAVTSVKPANIKSIPTSMPASIDLIQQTVSTRSSIRKKTVETLKKAEIYPTGEDADMSKLAGRALDFFREPPFVLVSSPGGGGNECGS